MLVRIWVHVNLYQSLILLLRIFVHKHYELQRFEMIHWWSSRLTLPSRVKMRSSPTKRLDGLFERGIYHILQGMFFLLFVSEINYSISRLHSFLCLILCQLLKHLWNYEHKCAFADHLLNSRPDCLYICMLEVVPVRVGFGFAFENKVIETSFMIYICLVLWYLICLTVTIL